MNPMLAALQKSRNAIPQQEAEVEGEGGDTGPGDAMLEKLSSLESKLDKICAALKIDGAAGKEPDEMETTEAKPNDDGY